MKTVIDPLFLRRPRLNYVSPAICETLFSSSSFPIIVLNPILKQKGPTGLVVISNLPGHIRIGWDIYPRALCYKVYFSTNTAVFGEDCDCSDELVLIGDCVSFPDPDGYPVDDYGCLYVSAVTKDGETEISGPLCVTPPVPPPDPCLRSRAAIPLQQRSGAVSLTPSEFRGPGFFAQQYTFAGLAGEEITIWTRSAVFDPFIYLAFGGVAIASNTNGGYKLTGDVGAAAIVFTLPSDGTYTIEVTTLNAGETGAFYTSWSSGRYSPSYTSPDNMRALLYEPTLDRVWLFQQAGNIDILDPVTLALITTVVIDSPPPNDARIHPLTDKIYAAITNGQDMRIYNPDGSIVTDISLGFQVGGTNGYEYPDPNSSRLWLGNANSGGGIYTLDVLTNLVANIATGAQVSTDCRVSVDSVGICWANGGGASQLFKVTPLGVVTPFPGTPCFGNRIDYIAAANRLYFRINDGATRWCVFDPSTELEVFRSSPSDFSGAVYSACADLIYVCISGGIGIIDPASPTDIIHFMHLPNHGRITEPSVDGSIYVFDSTVAVNQVRRLPSI